MSFRIFHILWVNWGHFNSVIFTKAAKKVLVLFLVAISDHTTCVSGLSAIHMHGCMDPVVFVHLQTL